MDLIIKIESLAIQAVRGCPQGGVLSLLLWSLLVDDLLLDLTSAGYDVEGYSDDL